MPRAPMPSPAEIEAAQRTWLAAAIEASFGQRPPVPRFPRPRREPLPRLPDLFDTPVPPEPPRGREISDLLMELYAGVISPVSPLTLKRRKLKAERAAAAAAEKAAAPAPVAVPAEPVLVLTTDFGHLTEHDKKPVVSWVVCAPFSLHEEDDHEVVDELLGQVVGIEPARALLFRRRDPDIMDGVEVGSRYVLLRFWDDKVGQVWSMPVEGDDDRAVLKAIETAAGLYRWSKVTTS